MKRFEQIEFLKLRNDLDQYQAYFDRQEEKFVQKMRQGGAGQFSREQNIGHGVSQLVSQHLQILCIAKLEEKPGRYLDRTIDYFYGKWWTSDDDRERVDKSLPVGRRNLVWCQPLMHGLLMSGLLDRWDDSRRLCNWVDESVTTEFRFDLTDEASDCFLMVLASRLRDKPLQDEAQIRKFLLDSSSKHPKLLLAILDAISARDQNAFAKRLEHSLQFAEKHTIEDVPTIRYWAALPESVLWLVAEHSGLTLPSLPPNLDALLVRRQTVWESRPGRCS